MKLRNTTRPKLRAPAMRLVLDGAATGLRARDARNFLDRALGLLRAPPAGQWATLRLSLDVFQPSSRGRAVPDAPPLRGARIEQVGLMIADRQFGAVCPMRLSAASSLLCESDPMMSQPGAGGVRWSV